MDLTSATPVEVDTALAEIYSRYYAIHDQIALQRSYIKEFEKAIAKKTAEPRYERQLYSYTPERLEEFRVKVADLHQQAAKVMQEADPYEAEYARRPWTRFFLVQNNGGHIHSSMHCTTCNKGGSMTRFGWLPDLSGRTEPEAVKSHGAILCTVCYPSAPVEWTDRRDDSVCEGSGQYYDSSLPHRGPHFYSGNWAECPVCHTNQTMVKSGKIRKHKKP